METLVCSRFREERERLGLSQPEVGRICGVTKKTVFLWEQGAKIPIHALVALIPFGIDIGYVIEGRHAKPLELSAAERTLIERYRSLDADGQRTALALLLALMEGSTPGAIRMRGRKKPNDS